MLKVVGKGNTAIIYQYSTSQVLKVFASDYPKDAIQREMNNSCIFNRCFNKSPICYGLKTKENKTGICYEYIKGKTLSEIYLQNHDEMMVMNIIVSLQKAFLNCSAYGALDYRVWLNDVSEGAYTKEIMALPQSNNLCHGDFHPGNILIDENNEAYIIDFMNVCRGPKQYDIARTYYLLSNANEEFAKTYLATMSESFENIENYLKVIHKCRICEMK